MVVDRIKIWKTLADKGFITSEFAESHIARGEKVQWRVPPRIHFDLGETFFGAHEQKVRSALALFQENGYEMVAITNDILTKEELIKEIDSTEALPKDSFSLLYKFRLSGYSFYDPDEHPKCELLIDNNPDFVTSRGGENLLNKLYLSHIYPKAM